MARAAKGDNNLVLVRNKLPFPIGIQRIFGLQQQLVKVAPAPGLCFHHVNEKV
ncbi:hypothetical protein ADIS_0487 [Lunatimonas lonarensis]|uniref:Uncharacterized protein n=1 Tax=Lunatimonas lonarensis TaxID=1232681 RepID=R7ZY48_9BACT|nr:hypothetical protein ADIS_0487 [Lunatimonas lonarensis]